MVVRGHVSNGVVVLDEPNQLPEGIAVRIETIPNDANPVMSPTRRTGGCWRGQVTIAEDFDLLPEDIADAFGVRAS